MRVIPHICAILAVGLAVEAAPPVPPADAPADTAGTTPVHVVFRLKDGVRIDGTLTTWHRDGFDGSFGRRAWTELRADDAWRLMRRLIDENASDDWISLGRMALLHDALERRAETAFAAALELDPEAAERIDAARAEAAAIIEARSQRANEAARFERAMRSPEAEKWPADPWPALTPQQMETARLSLFTDAENILAHAGATIEPVESDFFIVYTDAPRADAAKWAVRVLDHWYREGARLLGLAENQNIFWGKAVVFIFEEQDDFRLIEAGAFNYLVSLDRIAITHYSGPKVFINAWRSKDTLAFEADLVRAMARGMLHRFQTPRRLPVWANEGFAEYLAQRRVDESTYSEGNRPLALRLVRSGHSIAPFLEMSYTDEGWPGPASEGEAIAALLIEFLMKSNHEAFVEWMKAVKAEFDWRTALEQHFKGSIADFLDQFVRFYRAND